MSLLLGLIAACAWALHDICVRGVSQKTRILPALLTVLVAGTVMLLPVTAYQGGYAEMTDGSFALAAVSGVVFGLASLSLYGAFRIGPVRLVAPVIGAYPVVSVGWAAVSGASISVWQWLAVIVVVLGVALVAALSDSEETHGETMRAVMLSVIAGAGFAITFAASQAAVRHGAEMPVILSSRVFAAATIGAILILRREAWYFDRTVLLLLLAMACLDATALASVTSAGTFPHPEFASVASSLFGLLTVVLAWLILKEPMSRAQWGAVVMVFCGIGYLGI
ncbi:DMT family transporter [Sedimentitalea todarodis]|uniref:DMT family transporter n=1 Tax=Sedimentitalea todarodis TaxID=1631240 RepID=A0ABU3VIL2_9RHOB|nr:DMT family transporter [Sedimentitalea todarodis]MDU9006012.1 DMT family transporter [Sedimentitalea todarodis]